MIVIDLGVPLATLHIEVAENVIGNMNVNDLLDIHTGVVMAVTGLHNIHHIGANVSERPWFDVVRMKQINLSINLIAVYGFCVDFDWINIFKLRVLHLQWQI